MENTKINHDIIYLGKNGEYKLSVFAARKKLELSDDQLTLSNEGGLNFLFVIAIIAPFGVAGGLIGGLIAGIIIGIIDWILKKNTKKTIIFQLNNEDYTVERTKFKSNKNIFLIKDKKTNDEYQITTQQFKKWAEYLGVEMK